MILSQIEPYLGDYFSSEHLLFLKPELKEHAEEILRAFFSKAEARGVDSLEALKATLVETILLQDMGKLALDIAVKRAIPELLEGFFGYLKDSGRYPASGNWQICVEALADKYRGSLREDGTQRGETFKKASVDMGRNDPCFCGSGKKFKKCCGPMMGM